MQTLLLSNLAGLALKAFTSIPGLILLILDILAIRNLWHTPGRSDLNKVVWTSVIFFFPFVGLILYFFFGMERNNGTRPEKF